MPERVAITGVSAITPVATTAADFAAALRAGRSGVRPISAFPAAGFETRIAAEVDGAFDPSSFAQPRKAAKLMSRATLFAVAAAAMARQDAGLGSGDVDPERLAVSLGAGGMGPVDLDMLQGQHAAILAAAREQEGGYEHTDLAAFARAYRALTNPIQGLRGLPNSAAANVAIQQNARGPNNTIATACTSGTQAIGEGMRLIRSGAADVVFAGGTDAMVNPVGILGFGLLGTLSRRNDEPERASRPFDRDRDGFVVGEGAAVVVLERESFARARGARVLAEAAGYGVTCDAYRITDERPDASGATAAIRRCLEDAGADPGDVQYINAHGTGTKMNDQLETRAIRAALGAHAQAVAVSSTKSMIGHLVAAAGAVECVACVIALAEQFLPPTINYDTPDPECDLDYVPNRARPRRIDAALSNSFGFGGQNACLMIRRW
jgi:3-oxoacyl-[acyl-carrier-protein] synthase II